MAYQNKNYKKRLENNSKSKVYISLVFIVFLVLVVAYYFIFIKKDNVEVINNDAKTTSTAPTAQENFSEGDERTVEEANRDKGEAIVSDNQGAIPEATDQSQWTTSNTGEITLYSPAKDQLVNNGDHISGESSLPVVSFRIIDDISGVISTGQLSVVSGKFSGNISFSTTAVSGRLDIYGTRYDGGEFSNVEVPVRFK